MPGAGSIKIADPVLIAELVDVAGLCVNSCRVDALHCMGPKCLGQLRRVISKERLRPGQPRAAGIGWRSGMVRLAQSKARSSDIADAR